MTIFDRIYKLSKKTSQALLKGKDITELEETDLFDDEDKIHIQQNLSNEEIRKNIKILNQIDKENDWKSVHRKIQPREKSPMVHFYKVAAVILIFISVGYLTFYNSTNIENSDTTITEISAGTDKAILTLQNGVDIALEKENPYENDVVKSDGERLKYTKTNTNSKIAFNYLTIPRGGQYQIELSDGTLVWLNADTKLKYPVNFVEGEPRIVELVYGEAYFEVSPSANNHGDMFKVVTKMQEVGVLGTEFNIKAYNDEHHIYTTLVEGHVNILVDGTLEQLYPSEQTVIDIRTKQVSKSIVNVDYHVAWVKGYFNFKDTPLKEIMKILSRWYDVNITFEAQPLENVKFSGLLNKKQNIEDILNGIKNTKFINAYDIKNKTITIK